MKVLLSIVVTSLWCGNCCVSAFHNPYQQTRYTRCIGSSSSFPQRRQAVPPSSSTTTCLYADLEPLASEGDWQAYLDDETTGLIYYFNVQTGQSLWEPPTETFPAVKLPRRKQRLAENLRTQYRMARQAELDGTVITDTATDETDEKKDGPNWIGGLFDREKRKRDEEEDDEEDDKDEDVVAEIDKSDVAAKEEKGPGWLGGVIAGGIASVSEGIASAASKPTEEEKAKPTKAEPVQQQQPVAETKSKEETKPFGFLDALTSKLVVDDKPSTETKEEPIVDAPTKQPKVEKAPSEGRGPSFLDNLFTKAATTMQPQEKKDAEKPKVEVAAKKQEQPKPKPVQKRRTLLIPRPKEVKVTKETPQEKEVRKTILIPQEERPAPSKIDTAAYVLPHPLKMRWGGEDAVFTKGRTFGVFDGVTGAEKLDGVPLYSKTLASKMKTLVGTGNEALSVQDLAKRLTEAAEYADVSATGASTAMVASIGEDGYLRVLNLGDSSCVVIRDGKVKAKSREISHYFECPYQLAEDSPDRPKDGTKLNVELLVGDMIIMGSDGVFDNLGDDQILDIVNGLPLRPSLIAKKVVDASRKASLDPKAETPYAKLAKRRGDREFASGTGGKLDDSSCIVAICK